MSDYPVYLSSSIISAIVTKTAIAPLERVKILKQVQSFYNYSKYKGFYNSLYTIYKQEGFYKGFFKGNWANIIRVIPNYGIKFPMNDIFKTQYDWIHLTGITPSLSSNNIIVWKSIIEKGLQHSHFFNSHLLVQKVLREERC